MDTRVNILGVNVDKVNVTGAVDKLMQFLNEDRLHSVYTPNSEIIMAAYKDEEFRDVLNKSDLLTADGIGVVYASRILKNPIAERCAGFDIACELLERVNGTSYKIFLFGGKPGVAELAREKLMEKYPSLNICGCRNGYFTDADEPEIIDEINNSGADIVFVCLGAPKQEKWIDKNRDKLKARLALGIGGSLDVFAGTAMRAPEFYCKHGLEWLYRLMKQPSRIGRMMALPKFGFTVLIKGKKFTQD